MKLPTNSEIYKIIKTACIENDLNNLAENISLRWSNRMTASMGTMKRHINGAYTMSLSIPLFERATKEEQRQTIIHETCHAIGREVSGKMAHNWAWSRAMVLAGVKPEVYHNISNKGLVTQYIYVCPCGEHLLSARKHKLITNKNYAYRCSVCKEPIVFTGKISRKTTEKI